MYLLLFYLFLPVLANDEFFSAARQGNIDVLSKMINEGFDVSSVDAKGNPALIIAAGRGRVDALKILLAHGANIESISTQGLFLGKTALMWAASQGRTDAVKLLIEVWSDFSVTILKIFP